MASQQARVLRFFVVNLSCYPSYEDVRIVVERSEPLALRVPHLPYSPPVLTVFAVLLFDRGALGSENPLALEWANCDGTVTARREEVLRIPADAVVPDVFRVSFVANFLGLRLLEFGTYEAQLRLNGETLQVLPVDVETVMTET